ncbi:acyltransferase ChoActase/COT/CPT [Gautieria morchelliformis]|nr:acyltransferase ChoActase/COT/CPT [Gautieria morchelliformis]
MSPISRIQIRLFWLSTLSSSWICRDDPTPSRGSQLPRAAALIVSSLGFIHDLRAELLEPDTVRGVPLDMDQYKRLFGTARVPTDRGCKMEIETNSRHIAIIRRGQFYYFDVLDSENRPVLTERDILRNLQAIIADADTIPVNEVARQAVGVLSTENRKVWSHHREVIQRDRHNADCLRIVDTSLFVVCLDDAAPDNLAELSSTFLCGTYSLSSGVQVGTCTNRWYDKLQIIVCANGAAGINFEHTGVDGHTVLRFAADIFTDGLMLLARSINPSAPSFFRAKLSPLLKSIRGKANGVDAFKDETIDTSPKKLEWTLTPELRIGIRFAETRLSDLICQNDCQALEFKGYGKNFITRHGFSPDAFVQMAFQAAYFGLYGRIECTYEPAMTKAFLHGRTEAVRTVQPDTVAFTKVFFSEQSTPEQKISALRRACDKHVKLTRECSKGLGQDRHLYALYCLLQREIKSPSPAPDPIGTTSPPPTPTQYTSSSGLPPIFTDPGWALLNTSILSSSNCGNPALRLFGFGPVAADGFGIGYIIKDEGVSICASSKHLQTRRYLDTIQGYLQDVQRLIIHIYRQANERPPPFMDHAGTLRDAKTGHAIVKHLDGVAEDELDDEDIPGYSFFDSGGMDLLNRRRDRRRPSIGKRLQIAEY